MPPGDRELIDARAPTPGLRFIRIKNAFVKLTASLFRVRPARHIADSLAMSVQGDSDVSLTLIR